jgi:hypothetical protein
VRRYENAILHGGEINSIAITSALTASNKDADSAARIDKLVVTLLRLVGLGVLGFAAYWCWHRAEDAGWISHEELAVVIAKDWSTGEYRECSQPNLTNRKPDPFAHLYGAEGGAINTAVADAPPEINCSNNADGAERRLFKVRFYGWTYRRVLLNKAIVTWRCQREGSADPAFKCDDQKIVSWDDSKQ